MAVAPLATVRGALIVDLQALLQAGRLRTPRFPTPASGRSGSRGSVVIRPQLRVYPDTRRAAGVQYPTIWFAVEQETEREWSAAAQIEATSTALAVAHVAKEAGTYRVRADEMTKTEYFRVPAWGMPQPLRSKNGRSHP